MKTIFIETVSNGWLVRLHESSLSYVSEPIAVYNFIGDLQAALPVLLGIEPDSSVAVVAPKLAPPKEKIQNYDTLPTRSILQN